MDDGSGAAPTTAQADSDYLRVLTRYGDRKPLVVAQPIYSSTGIKLLDAGAKVDSRVFERLFNHRLAAPIDQCVATGEAVRTRELPEAALARVTALPALDRSTARDALRKRVAAALLACPLPPAIATRLTVARTEAPALYDHSLRAAFLACYLGAAADLAARELEVLATAGLLHDIGMLHADPALFSADRPLSPSARRHLQAHPLIGEMVARSDPALSPAIADAIAQHHERLDGLGYPRGLAGERIGRLGRILMIVEVALAVFEHVAEQPELQLSLILRLNHRSFDRAISGALLGSLPGINRDSPNADCCDDGPDQMLAHLQAWQRIRAGESPSVPPQAIAHVDTALGRLQRLLDEAGYTFNQPRSVNAESPAEAAERCAIAREALWQLRQIAVDAAQRWPACIDADAAGQPGTVAHWISGASRLGTGSA